MRDMQLIEAKTKKSSDFKNQREHEIQFVSKLRSEIEEEQRIKLEKRKKERDQAWRIINENELYKQKQLLEKAKEKEKDNKIMQDYNKFLDEQEKRRADEWAARENRIQGLMSKMADTVVKRSNDAEREEERRVLRYQLEKEEREKNHEERQKEIMRKKYEEIRQKLDQQVQQKKAQKDYEFLVNDDHMKKWN